MKRLSKNPPVSEAPHIDDDLRTVLDALPIGVLLADKDGRIIHTSRLAGDLPAEALRAIERGLAQTMTGGQSAMEAADFARPDGTQTSLLFSVTALHDKNGNLTGAVAAVGDVTGQRQKEREAIRRTIQLEALLLHAPIGIAFIDENLRYLALTNVPVPSGKSRKIRSGVPLCDEIRSHHPPAVADEVINIHKTVLETGVPFKGSGWKIPRPNGSHYYIDWEIRRVSTGKKILGLVGTAVDVTSHIETRDELEKLKSTLEQTVKERTAELARANATVATILDSIADGFFATDNKWRVTYFNRTAELLTGADRSQATGSRLWDLFPDSPAFQEPLRRVMAGRRPEHFETRGLYGDKWLEGSAYPSADGGLVVSFRDITERKTTEQELLRLCSLDLVGQMAAGISHEVRNPLTTVKGFLQLLARKPSYTDDKDIIELMISEIDRASGIISQYGAIFL